MQVISSQFLKLLLIVQGGFGELVDDMHVQRADWACVRKFKCNINNPEIIINKAFKQVTIFVDAFLDGIMAHSRFGDLHCLKNLCVSDPPEKWNEILHKQFVLLQCVPLRSD